MAKYLTVSQYRLADEGLPNVSFTANSGFADSTILAYISRAETAIDSFMGFDPKLGGFEPHQTWYEQRWDSETRKNFLPNFPVPVRSVQRYKIQVSNANSNGDDFSANIDASGCAFNVFSEYIELIPLQSVVYSMAPIMVAFGLNPPITQIDYTVGFYLPANGDQLLNPSGDLQTYQAFRGFWANSYTVANSIIPLTQPITSPVVYKNGSIVNPSQYTVSDLTNGVVHFNAPNLSSDVITSDYTYQIPDLVRDATIAQTTYMLASRTLNQVGMAALEQMHAGGQMARKSRPNPKISNFLCVEAQHKLERYTNIPGA